MMFFPRQSGGFWTTLVFAEMWILFLEWNWLSEIQTLQESVLELLVCHSLLSVKMPEDEVIFLWFTSWFHDYSCKYYFRLHYLLLYHDVLRRSSYGAHLTLYNGKYRYEITLGNCRVWFVNGYTCTYVRCATEDDQRRSKRVVQYDAVKVDVNNTIYSFIRCCMQYDGLNCV